MLFASLSSAALQIFRCVSTSAAFASFFTASATSALPPGFA